MPIEYKIDNLRRRVNVRAFGFLSATDVFAYQRDVWSRVDLGGYDELFDLSEVTELEKPEAFEVRELAHKASNTACGPEGSVALVAPSDQLYGLARMYQSYRNLTPKRPKDIGVFRKRSDAEIFLQSQAVQQQ